MKRNCHGIVPMVLVLGTLVPGARAGLTHLTPGGFSVASEFPEAYREFLRDNGRLFTLFDEARVIPYRDPEGNWINPNGWVSRFGSLKGGVWFGTDLVDRTPTPDARVFWDFQESGYALSRIYVYGRADDGTVWENLYRVSHLEFARSADAWAVDLGGHANIGGIAFYGRTPGMPISDGGVPAVFVCASLVAIAMIRHLQVTRSRNDRAESRRAAPSA